MEGRCKLAFTYLGKACNAAQVWTERYRLARVLQEEQVAQQVEHVDLDAICNALTVDHIVDCIVGKGRDQCVHDGGPVVLQRQQPEIPQPKKRFLLFLEHAHIDVRLGGHFVRSRTEHVPRDRHPRCKPRCEPKLKSRKPANVVGGIELVERHRKGLGDMLFMSSWRPAAGRQRAMAEHGRATQRLKIVIGVGCRTAPETRQETSGEMQRERQIAELPGSLRR